MSGRAACGGGTEAEALGWGGIVAVARATRLAISTVTLGRNEVREGVHADDVVRVRRKGGGRRRHEVMLNDNYISPTTTITSPHPQQRDVAG